MATALSRWLAPIVLAAGFGVVALSPGTARANDGDELARVIVDVADVIFRSGTPYYRHSDYGYNDRLVVARDRYGRPIYYRNVYRNGPPYGNAYGYYRNGPGRHGKCNHHGKCKTQYYDARYDRRYDNRYYGYDRYDRHDYRGDRRWRDHDDD
ncbi:hypothetical protein ACFOLC_10245 [Lysobacter cavernae]|uniref:DUF2502 domain-containing protein n=1 Tax=Lysobacter cavernae TaxID=1685901 RepID=A0ABV7RP26_9GAMM